jgi:hypothetical protein
MRRVFVSTIFDEIEFRYVMLELAANSPQIYAVRINLHLNGAQLLFIDPIENAVRTTIETNDLRLQYRWQLSISAATPIDKQVDAMIVFYDSVHDLNSRTSRIFMQLADRLRDEMDDCVKFI